MFYLESRLQTNPAGNSGYAGLSQISVPTLQNAYHLTRDQYTAMSAADQINTVISHWYKDAVRRYLGKTPRSPGVLYALNIAPGVVKTSGDGEDVVLYASPSTAYARNSNLDYSHDGNITIGDLDLYMINLANQPAYQSALMRLNSVNCATVAEPTSMNKTLKTAAIILGIGLVSAYAIERQGRHGRFGL